MKTRLFVIALLLMIPAVSLFAQGASKDAADSTEQIPDPDEFVPYEEEPKYDDLYSHLKYPEEARKNNIQGKVVVQVFVSSEGKVLKTRILKYKGLSDNPLLEQAALDAIMQTTFTPAIQSGKPIGVWISIPFNFSLK